MVKSKIIAFLMIVLPIALSASGAEHHDVTMSNSDFFYRVLNFSIFIGTLLYLYANPIKAFFKERSEGIAKQLKEIEDKLQSSKDEAKKAQEALAYSESKAKEIIEDSKKEAIMLAQNIEKKSVSDLELMDKQFVDKVDVEGRKASRATINSVLNDGFSSDDITLDSSKIVSLVSKKVA